jgi:PKD repeat protein
LCIVFLISSCSKTGAVDGPEDPEGNDKDPDIALKACFTLSNESILVGEKLVISNCSKGATTYTFDIGNGSQGTDASPEVVYEEGGEYTITLTVTNAREESKTFSLPVFVTSAASYYIYPNVPEGYSYLPLEAGFHPQNGRPYVLELREDLTGPGGSKYYYRGLDESYVATSHYIADKPFNSNSAFVNFLTGGSMNFHFPRTLASLYGSQELTYNSSWGFISNINPANRHNYGYLPVGGNYLYYGTADDSGTYKAAIEHRNSGGDTFQVDLHALGDSSSMIGDMIKVENGYIAFGGVFTWNTFAPQITGFKPVLAFFDASLNLTSEVVLEESELDAKISSPNHLNGPYHIEQLSNGNLVLYANGELLVTGSTGNLIKHSSFGETKPIQALISLGDGFIISTDNYLRKYQANGDQVKELKYDGNYLPELLEKDGKLFFIAGYDTGDGIKMFYGMADTNLNLLPIGM